MEFRILGPVEVVSDGRVLALGPSKQRALLALLLLHVNEVVSRERLIEDLWGERAPNTVVTSLHTYVSQLRKLLEAGNGAEPRVLLTRAPGYLLALDAEQVDLARFERLAREGKQQLAANDEEAAADTLAEALSLWRGPPLAEFASTPFALAETLRLQELRISTLEDRIEADLALARHQQLVVELETLAREHPFRERLHGQLMLALYRSGRQAEALDVYRQTRRRLVEELGIGPGPALQELEQAILRQEPAIAPASRSRMPGAVEAPAPVAEQGPGGAEPRVPNPDQVRLRGRRRALSPRALALLAALMLALGLAFAFSGRERPSIRLAPNSVGFVDAKSGRVTKSFSVGPDPRALAIAFHSLWVANYDTTTVTRIDRNTGATVTIPVRGHPTGIAAAARKVWVWTLEGLLVPIDPRFDTSGQPIRLQAQAASAGRVVGGITAGGGSVWVAAPPTTVIRVDATNPRSSGSIVPDGGVQGPIAYRNGKAWVAGSDHVFPIAADTGFAGSGIPVGTARDLAFADGDLWVVSGGAGHLGGVVQRLRRVDLQGRLVQATIAVGADPTTVAAGSGSIWTGSGSDGTVSRIDPRANQVVESISVGASPVAVAADDGGVWIAVR